MKSTPGMYKGFSQEIDGKEVNEGGYDRNWNESNNPCANNEDTKGTKCQKATRYPTVAPAANE